MNIISLLLLLIAYTVGTASVIVTAITFQRGYSSRDQLLFIGSFFLLLVMLSLDFLWDTFPDFIVLISLILFAISIPRAVNSSRPSTPGKKGIAILNCLSPIPLLFLISKVPAVREVPSIIFLSLSLTLTAAILIISKGKSKLTLPPRLLKIVIPIISLITIPLVIAVDLYGSVWFPRGIDSGYYIFPLVYICLNGLFFFDSLKQLLKKSGENVNIFESFDLSKRELEVVALLLDGKSYTQIGRQLNVAQSTVKTHCSNIYFKLNISNRYELFRIVLNSSN